jgi:uncharacterized protein YcaQ
MARTDSSPPCVSVVEARRLLLGGQALLETPGRATVESVYRLVEHLGYVQVDSINVVERAHHLILAARLRGYRPTLLTRLLERDRRLFEHWTHDAAAIPTIWFPHWHFRFARYRDLLVQRAWWRERMGEDAPGVLAKVRAHLERAGPVATRDLGDPDPGQGGSGSWWGWSPRKAALEYLWLTGEAAIAGRRGFHKLYDLTTRVLPQAASVARPTAEAHVEWACRTALERLGAASAEEIAAFWKAIAAPAARGWCTAAVRRGEVAAVTIAGAGGSAPRPGFAVTDWRERAAAASSTARMRLLCPFDPILRDRRRTLRLFGFDFRFEAFVPAAERRHGYYVMPVLQGDRLVGRIDPKLHRETGRLEVRTVWWEPGSRPSRRRLAALEAAVGRLAAQVGASRWDLPS